MRHIEALVIDPSPRTRRMLTDALKSSALAEFGFTEAENGAQALKRYKRGTLDVIFLDLIMPEMGGVEFLQALDLQHPDHPPAVVVTAETSRERLMAAVNHVGVKALIFKPIDAARLKRDLKGLIEYLPYRERSWAAPFGDCVEQSMSEMLVKTCKLDAAPEPTDQPVGTGDVVFATIPVRGAVKWTVVLGFERDAAEEAARRFGIDDISFDDPDIGDVIGELANQVAGHLKRVLDARGVFVDISTPTVLRASSITVLIQPPDRTRIDQVCFDSPMGKFWVGITVGANAGLVL